MVLTERHCLPLDTQSCPYYEIREEDDLDPSFLPSIISFLFDRRSSEPDKGSRFDVNRWTRGKGFTVRYKNFSSVFHRIPDVLGTLKI